MTCIVAVSSGRDVVMGADSAYSSGPVTGVGLECKLLRVGTDVVIGFGGELGSMAAVQRRRSDLPRYSGDVPTEEYVSLALLPEIATVLRDAGRMVNERGTERMEVEMLVAVGADIFHVTPSFAVFRPEMPYWAIGTGAPYALGVLYASCSWPDQEARVRRALSAASRFCPSVRSPFSIMFTAAVEEAA